MRKNSLVVNLLCVSLFVLIGSAVHAQDTSERYAYIEYIDNEPVLSLLDIETLDTELREFPRLSDEKIHEVFLSPQGHWLLIQIVTPTPRWRLWHLNDGTTVDVPFERNVLSDGSAVASQSLAWSPDERYIAFNSPTTDSRADITIYDRVTNSLVKITPPEISHLHLAWSADSQRLVTTRSHCHESRCDPMMLEIYEDDFKQPAFQFPIEYVSDSPADQYTDVCNLQWSPGHQAVAYMTQCDMTLPIVPSDIYVQTLNPPSVSSTQFLLNNTDIPFSELIFKGYNNYAWLNADTLVIGSMQTIAHLELSDETPLPSKIIHATYLLTPPNQQLTSLFASTTRDWTVSSAGYAAYIQDSDDGTRSTLVISQGDYQTPLATFDAGCEIKWAHTGDILAYVEGERGSTCTREFSRLGFVNLQAHTDFTYPLAGQKGLALGWVSLNP